MASSSRGTPDLGGPDRSATAWSASGLQAALSAADVPLPRLLDRAAEDFPTTRAVDAPGRSLTYRQLVEAVDRFAGVLAGLGVARGDRVAVWLPTCERHLVASFAVLRLGGIVALVDPTSTGDEAAVQLRDSGSVVVVCAAGHAAEIVDRRAGLPALRHVVVAAPGAVGRDTLPALRRAASGLPLPARPRPDRGRRVRPQGALDMEELLAATAPTAVQARLDAARDLAAIVYTRPPGRAGRGVALTHRNLVAGALQARLWLPDVVAGAERVLCVLPFSSPAGLGLGVGLGVVLAATLVAVPRFTPQEALRTIARTRPTLLPAVPAVIAALCDAAPEGSADLRSIRIALAVGAPLPAEIAAAFERLTGGVVREGYGRPEAGPLTHATPVGGPAARGSVGPPVPATASALRDPRDPSAPAEPGGPGLLAIAGPQVMAGFWQRHDETAEVLVDGWLVTGDLATVDAAGFVSVVDRGKDVVVVDGNPVAPQPIERLLGTHPAVDRAVVVGLPDVEHGERLQAWVVLRRGSAATEEQLVRFLRERMSGQSLPVEVDIQVRGALPAGLVGRALRVALVEEALAAQRGG